MEKQREKFLAIVLLTALAARLVALVIALLSAPGSSSPVVLLPDSFKYIDAATNIMRAGEFARNRLPEIFLSPGYPLFLSGVSALAGNMWGALVAQLIISVLTAYVVF